MQIAVITFVTCLIVILGAYWALVVRPEQQDAASLAKRLKQSLSGVGVAATVATQEAKTSAVPAIARLLERNIRFSTSLQRLLTEADVKMTPGIFLALTLLAAAVGWAVGVLVVGYVVIGLLLAVFVGMLPLTVVRFLRNKRLHTFEEQLPEAVDLVARALRAGHAFTTGLGMAAEELPAPIGIELKRVFDQQNFGMSLPDALRGMAQRVPVLDARFFVTAVLTQRESGGNLAEVLDNLSAVMRERFKVKRQIRVISAHGRITAWVLCLIPPALAALLTLVSPDALKPLFTDPLGQNLVILALVLQLVGSYIISRLVKIEY